MDAKDSEWGDIADEDSGALTQPYQGFLNKLLPVFSDAEDLEQLTALHHLCTIMQATCEHARRPLCLQPLTALQCP